MSFTVKGIFEVHLGVSDRMLSAEFYQRVLNFKLAREIPDRDVTFLWMGDPGSRMLGLWGPACPNPPVTHDRSHFALELPAEEIRSAPDLLLSQGIVPLDLDGNPTSEPIVIAWMPAVSIYFKDPDGHSLEFIAMLPEPPNPDLRVVSLSEWEGRRLAASDR